ncbi:MAG TPA: DegT/DnrJ/EryC1/StrS family aminotransferase [Armatimonadota bacterium]|nr:DegT/DnrJ/EryC1/StrS family aminotransferase [Armatimonadota bacterium]
MPTRVFDDRDLGLVREVLQSGHLSILDGGQLTPRFQKAFAEAHGAKHGVAMNCAMSVLHASVISAGAGAGDEVICDPVCVFGAMATMYANAIPVFVDVNPVTWNMDPDAIEARITERTKALIVTHVCGLPAEIDRIVEVAHRHGIVVIEDCAHALLTRYKGRCVGTWGDIGSFSFQASKQMGLGDGGMALTDNDELAGKLNLHAGAPTFMSVAYGMHYNYRMSEPVAAIGIAQLERLPGYIEGLRRAAAMLDAAVADCEFIDLQRGPAEAEHSFHLWGATFHGERIGLPRDDFARVLEEEQVGIGMGYTNMPAYRHPLIAERLGAGRGCPLDCPLYEGTGNQYPDGLCPKVEALFPNIILGYPFQPDDAVAAQADRLRRAVERLA